MAIETNIGWTDHTFNIAWGCNRYSPGCKNCYAELLARRYGHDVWGPHNPRRTFGDKHWREPLKWDRDSADAGVRRRVFCSSMCDLFEDHATIDSERGKLWPLICATPSLDWQLLTKRADRVAKHLPADWGSGYANAWIGVSIENDHYVDRADRIRDIPAAVRFISYEPALGPLDRLDLTGIDWVIYGGESGPRFREHDPSWAECIAARCAAAGVAFFYKQDAGRLPGRGAAMAGRIVNAFPTPRKTIQKV